MFGVADLADVALANSRSRADFTGGQANLGVTLVADIKVPRRRRCAPFARRDGNHLDIMNRQADGDRPQRQTVASSGGAVGPLTSLAPTCRPLGAMM